MLSSKKVRAVPPACTTGDALCRRHARQVTRRAVLLACTNDRRQRCRPRAASPMRRGMHGVGRPRGEGCLPRALRPGRRPTPLGVPARRQPCDHHAPRCQHAAARGGGCPMRCCWRQRRNMPHCLRSCLHGEGLLWCLPAPHCVPRAAPSTCIADRFQPPHFLTSSCLHGTLWPCQPGGTSALALWGVLLSAPPPRPPPPAAGESSAAAGQSRSARLFGTSCRACRSAGSPSPAVWALTYTHICLLCCWGAALGAWEGWQRARRLGPLNRHRDWPAWFRWHSSTTSCSRPRPGRSCTNSRTPPPSRPPLLYHPASCPSANSQIQPPTHPSPRPPPPPLPPTRPRS